MIINKEININIKDTAYKTSGDLGCSKDKVKRTSSTPKYDLEGKCVSRRKG